MVYPATWAFWAAIRFGWDATAIGLSLAWVGLLTAIVQLALTGKVVARPGERRAAIVGLACAAAGPIASAFVHRGGQAFAFFLLGCLCACPSHPLREHGRAGN